MKIAKLGTTIAVLTLALVSCELETKGPELVEETNITEALEAIEDLGFANKMFQDAGNSQDAALISVEDDMGPGISEKTSGQPTITVTPLDMVTWPKTITIDFGTGITGPDGVHREGKMIVISTNWYKEKNSRHTTTFDHYYQNGNKVDGTHISENLGTNTDGDHVFEVMVTNGQITKKNGQVIYYEQESTRTWIAGDTTPLYIWDDEYLLDGEQWGKSSNNINYNLEIIDPLHFTLLPRSIVDGTLNADIGTLQGMFFDYKNRTVTINGVSYPF